MSEFSNYWVSLFINFPVLKSSSGNYIHTDYQILGRVNIHMSFYLLVLTGFFIKTLWHHTIRWLIKQCPVAINKFLNLFSVYTEKFSFTLNSIYICIISYESLNLLLVNCIYQLILQGVQYEYTEISISWDYSYLL